MRVHEQRVERSWESEFCCRVAYLELFVLLVIAIDSMQRTEGVTSGPREGDHGDVILLVRTQQTCREDVQLAVLVDECRKLRKFEPRDNMRLFGPICTRRWQAFAVARRRHFARVRRVRLDAVSEHLGNKVHVQVAIVDSCLPLS